MRTTSEYTTPTHAVLTVEVPYQEFEPALNKAYKNVAKQVDIPGFRRGRAPHPIIDQRIGRAYVIEQAINDSLDDIFRDALNESGMVPMKRAEVEVTKTPAVTGKREGELEVKFEFTCQPKFDLPELDDVTLKVERSEISVDDVEAELDKLRDRFSTLKGVDREVREGDFTSIDLVATIDGEEVDTASGVSYEHGSKTMLSGLDEAILGLSEGETASFDTTFVGGEHAGKEGKATVTVNKVKEKELPDPDDDFAMMASEFDTIGELRSDLRQQLLKQRDMRAGNDATTQLMDYFIEHTEMDLPEDIISENVEAQKQKAGDDFDEAQATKSVRESLKHQLIQQHITATTEAEISPEEMMNAAGSLAQMYGMQMQDLFQDYQALATLSDQLKANKALTLMLKDVKVIDGDDNPIDLSEFIAEAEPKPKDDDATDDDMPVEESSQNKDDENK